jgi:hypothetical protein
VKVGESLYCDGEKLGDLIYVSGFSMRDSKNPQFASADKSAQYSIILNRGISRVLDHDVHTWEIREEGALTQRVKVLQCHYDEHRTIMTVEVIPTHLDAHP